MDASPTPSYFVVSLERERDDAIKYLKFINARIAELKACGVTPADKPMRRTGK